MSDLTTPVVNDPTGVLTGAINDRGVRRVVSTAYWKTNAQLIKAAADVGYLKPTDRILDATYGRGIWWQQWQPDPAVGGQLVTMDIAPPGTDGKRPAMICADAVHPLGGLPFPDETFDVITLDPPFKLNGTPSAPDARYGNDVRATTAQRISLAEQAIAYQRAGPCRLCGDEFWPYDEEQCPSCHGNGMEGNVLGLAPLLRPGGRLLVKTMDQVAGGKVHWQSKILWRAGLDAGLELVDQFDKVTRPRSQKPDRAQQHAARNTSVLLVFQLS